MKKVMLNCIVCNKRSELADLNICVRCARNPFRVEDARDIYSELNLAELKKLYSKKFPEIKNLNTPIFWGKKMKAIQSLDNQDGMTKDRIRIAHDFLPLHAKKIFDIGAGNGYLEELLAKNSNIKIYANDFSIESVMNLKKRFNGVFKVEDIYNLHYADSYFDAVFILEVLEHVQPSEILNVLKKINKMLKPLGVLIISVPTNEGLEDMKSNFNGHVRTYTTSLISAELQLSGFDIKKITTLYAFKDRYFIKKHLASIFKNKWKPNNIILKATKRKL